MYKNLYKLASVSALMAITLSALILISLCVYVTVLIQDRNVPSDLTKGRIISLPDHIQGKAVRGGDAIVHFDIFRRKSCEVSYIQTIYDSNGVRFLLQDYPVGGNRPVGKPVSFDLGITIPKSASIGPAIYESTRRYTCNWTQLFAPVYVVDENINFNIE